ncbi:MAG: Zn-ribbon containing protein [Haloferacaceae archaeon]
MPHQCTSCGRVFEDGSKEMLSGCPECGGNKFQFRPSSALDDASDAPDSITPSTTTPSTATSSTQSSDRSSPTDSVDRSRPSETERPSPWPSSGRDSEEPTERSPEEPTERSPEETAETDPDDAEVVVSSGDPESLENHAQADARSGVVSEEELSRAKQSWPGPESSSSDADSGPNEEPATESNAGERPGLSELREELNSQFESIKIVSQGQYELNLMELYDRQEYIISLQEDGRYVIEMPDAWGPEDE